MNALAEAQLKFIQRWNAIVERWKPLRPELADWESLPEDIFENVAPESLTSMSAAELRESIGSSGGAGSPFWSAR